MSAGGPSAQLPALPASSGNISTGTDGSASTPRNRVPRSLPPWIDSYDPRYGDAPEDQLKLLSLLAPSAPEPSVPAQHNSTPADPQRRVSQDGYVDWTADPLIGRERPRRPFPGFLKRHDPRRGRRWDHLRTAEPVIVPGHASAARAPSPGWRDFLASSVYGHIPGEEASVVDADTLDALQPTFNKETDWRASAMGTRPSRRQRTATLYRRAWRAAGHHAFAPLAFRLTVMVTSLVALAAAAGLYQGERGAPPGEGGEERPQLVMAVAVDCVAVPYIGYMLWDEYTGKPLGLRSAVQKVLLILMDLFFIIFKSASTSLAFEALVYHQASAGRTWRLAQCLAAFILLGLVAWTMTFIVNVVRTVERLGGGEDEGLRV